MDMLFFFVFVRKDANIMESCKGKGNMVFYWRDLLNT